MNILIILNIAAESEEIRPARSVFDSLLGKGSSTAAQLLERKEKKEFVLDTKYSTSAAGMLIIITIFWS